MTFHRVFVAVISVHLLSLPVGCGGGKGDPVPVPAQQPWVYYPSGGWQGSSLTAAIPTGKAATVFVLNTAAGARDSAQATVAVTGTAPAAIAPSPTHGGPPVLERNALRWPSRTAEAPLTGRNKVRPTFKAAAAAGPPPVNTSFCVTPGATPPAIRRPATLVASTPSALFYIDDADAGTVGLSELEALVATWEGTIQPTITGLFGQPADTDGNGRVTILLSSAILGAVLMVGGYDWLDQAFPPDTTPDCSGRPHANGTDLLTVATPAALASAASWTPERATAELVGTLAHEFQHMVSFNMHCGLRVTACAADLQAGNPTEEVWLNEAMATVAEDAVGIGWASPLSDAVSSMQEYMLLSPAYGRKGYSQVGMTVFESDPVGNYQGVHSFLRYFVDRRGAGLLAALSGSPATGNPLKGRANLEAALGMTFEQAMADYATAVGFSNTGLGLDSRFDYTGAAWTPFHQKFGVLEAVAVNPGSASAALLRKDGWNAFITGPGLVGAGTLTVTSTEAVKPGVVVVLH